jgi:hypothetical protein
MEETLQDRRIDIEGLKLGWDVLFSRILSYISDRAL